MSHIHRAVEPSHILEIKETQIRPIVTSVVDIVRRHVSDDSCRILMFGSWATLEAAPTSDIDIGILGDQPIDALALARIRDELDHLPTLRKIEVVDLRQVNDTFRDRAMSRAERLA